MILRAGKHLGSAGKADYIIIRIYLAYEDLTEADRKMGGTLHMHDAASRQSMGRSLYYFFEGGGFERWKASRFGPLIRPQLPDSRPHVNPCRVPLCQINFCGV